MAEPELFWVMIWNLYSLCLGDVCNNYPVTRIFSALESAGGECGGTQRRGQVLSLHACGPPSCHQEALEGSLACYGPTQETDLNMTPTHFYYKVLS